MPGVIAILTGKDAAADGLGNIPCLIPVPGLKETPRPVLALGKVAHVGDPVAMVIAETLRRRRTRRKRWRWTTSRSRR